MIHDHLCTVTCTDEATEMAAKCLQKTSIYMYIYTYTNIYKYLQIYTCIYAYVYIYIYIYPFTYVYHIYSCVNTWYIYVNGYINIYCKYIYIYVYIHI